MWSDSDDKPLLSNLYKVAHKDKRMTRIHRKPHPALIYSCQIEDVSSVLRSSKCRKHQVDKCGGLKLEIA